MSCFGLVKAGYGTLKEVMELDTDIFLKALDYESTLKNIENIMIEEAKS